MRCVSTQAGRTALVIRSAWLHPETRTAGAYASDALRNANQRSAASAIVVKPEEVPAAARSALGV